MQFDRIPSEMREYNQWVCWRFEDRGGDKPTKVPVNPRTGYPASVTSAADWASFNEACAFANAPGASVKGIGFVFTDADPFAGIDLDGDGDVERRIADAFASYQEVSPSGRGLHIIVRGNVPEGRRRGSVELYSRARYFTMTGNIRAGASVTIADCGPLLNTLWEEMRPASADVDASAHYAVATEDDAAIFNRAADAANGGKFMRLWGGDGSDLSGDVSGSAIDQALVNILAFFTKDPAQIERLWLASPQGQREKTQTRPDYRTATINRAFDRESPQQDFGWLRDKLKGVVDHAKVSDHASVATMPPDTLPVLNASEFAGRTPAVRPWHVPDMVPGRTVTLFSGDGGTGKSLAALQLAVATVAGRAWLGAMVRQGACLFVTAEDDVDEVHRRLVDIGQGGGIGPDQLQRLAISSLAGRDALLAVPDGRSGVLKPTGLLAALRGYVEAHRPALIVLDTLADLFGGEENNRGQVRQFVALLRGLAIEFDASVLLLAHPSLTGLSSGSGLSGSTAWNNSVRSRLYLRRDEVDPNVRILETMKSNYGAVGQQLRLEWRRGVFVEVGRTSAEPAHKRIAEDATDELFLKLPRNSKCKAATFHRTRSRSTMRRLPSRRRPKGSRIRRPGSSQLWSGYFNIVAFEWHSRTGHRRSGSISSCLRGVQSPAITLQ